MSAKKEPFQRAIRKALADLQVHGEKITHAKVINTARFDNGKPVGKTTLYSKHAVTKECVHQDLLLEIKEITLKQKNGVKKVRKDQAMSSLKDELKALKEENGKLIDQVVEQEYRLNQSLAITDGNKHVVESLEQDIYVLASLVTGLTGDSIKDFTQLKRNYEVKYMGDPRINIAKKEIDAYNQDINRSRLVSIKDYKDV